MVMGTIVGTDSASQCVVVFRERGGKQVKRSFGGGIGIPPKKTNTNKKHYIQYSTKEVVRRTKVDVVLCSNT